MNSFPYMFYQILSPHVGVLKKNPCISVTSGRVPLHSLNSLIPGSIVWIGPLEVLRSFMMIGVLIDQMISSHI